MKIENCKAQIVGLHLISSILVLFILAATMLASPSQAYSADKSSTGKATKSSPGETAKPAAPDRSRTLGGVAPAKSDTFVTSYTNDPDTINPIIAHDSVS